MQFLALIMVNIIMFVIFYLIISLKLERKATEFREKRLRRVMEEMINEFNETAERNISLLENKIQTMRRLLKLAGEYSSLDVRVGDDDTDTKNSQNKVRVVHENSVTVASAVINEKLHTKDMFKSFYEGTQAIAKKFNELVNNVRSKAKHKKNSDSIILAEKHNPKNEVEIEENDNNVYSNGLNVESDKKCERIQLESDEEKIRLLFSSTHDKYALVSDLYGQGYSIEFISRCSGIPVGEVRLVLNLNQAI